MDQTPGACCTQRTPIAGSAQGRSTAAVARLLKQMHDTRTSTHKLTLTTTTATKPRTKKIGTRKQLQLQRLTNVRKARQNHYEKKRTTPMAMATKMILRKLQKKK